MNNKENTFSLVIKGMTCATCAKIVEKQLYTQAGVTYVSVNLATEKAFISGATDLTSSAIINKVKQAGYTAHIASSDQKYSTNEKGFKNKQQQVFLSVFIFILTMILMIFHMFIYTIPLYEYIELFSGLLVFFLLGKPVFKSAFIAFLHKHFNMDSLVSIGAIAAWSTALLSILNVIQYSFGIISIMIVTLHIIGKYIEQYLKQKAKKSLYALLKMQSDKVRVIKDGAEIMVPLDSVTLGSLIKIKAGERILLDGDVVTDIASVDQSLITGESIPVEKQKGDSAISGSVVINGTLTIKVNKIRNDTFISQMISLVEESQARKIPIQTLADNISKVFIPAVLTLSMTSFMVWLLYFEELQSLLSPLLSHIPQFFRYAIHLDPLSMGIFVSIAVIVIACPCALGLAIPMALIQGVSHAAFEGIIIRNAEVIQSAQNIDIICFDKTGTITQGRPIVVKHTIDDNIFSIVASIEAASIHPIAKAIMSYAEDNSLLRNIEVENIKEIIGEGIYGEYKNTIYGVKKIEFNKKYESWLQKGYTVVEVFENNVLKGEIYISDEIKEHAQSTISKLKARNILPVMITGDNETTAQCIAAEVGISTVYANKTPEEKVLIIRDFQKQGKTVAMIGDGYNDAAAIKSAEIGIALGNGADIAMDSGDIVLAQGDLKRIESIINISHSIMKKIKQNLFWAFIYNSFFIPFALIGLLHPLIAELAMIFSSFTVIINSTSSQKLQKWRNK